MTKRSAAGIPKTVFTADECLALHNFIERLWNTPIPLIRVRKDNRVRVGYFRTTKEKAVLKKLHKAAESYAKAKP